MLLAPPRDGNTNVFFSHDFGELLLGHGYCGIALSCIPYLDVELVGESVPPVGHGCGDAVNEISDFTPLVLAAKGLLLVALRVDGITLMREACCYCGSADELKFHALRNCKR